MYRQDGETESQVPQDEDIVFTEYQCQMKSVGESSIEALQLSESLL